MRNRFIHLGILAGALLGGPCGLWGQGGPKAAAPAEAPKVEAPAECLHCGMNRPRFARSRMLVTYADGATAGTCSIHCAAIELKAQAAKAVASIQVGDYGREGHPLIDARGATWVVGGDLPGVMTPLAKWAFSSKTEAEAFVSKHGGKLATYDEALDQARQDPPKKH